MRIQQSSNDPCRPASWRAIVGATGVLAVAVLFVTLPAPAAGQAFGGAVLVADGRVLVGEAAHEREPGSVRVYDYDGEWSVVATLRAPEPDVRDGFGSALASAGDFLFVGAGGGEGGLVYVYRLGDVASGTARPVQTLSDPGLTGFGGTLAASDTEFAVAARSAENGRVLATFRLGADGRWSFGGTLGVAERAGEMGATWVDLSGDRLVVGNPWARAVHVFEREVGGTGWGPPALVKHPDPEVAEWVFFGVAVAVFQDELLVGQLVAGPSQQEVVHRFTKVDGVWTAIGTLSPEREDPNFGWSLAVDGTTLLAGGGPQLFSYTRSGDAWAFSGASGVLDEGGGYGASMTADGNVVMSSQAVALGGEIVAYGNPGADFGLGAVSVLTHESGEWARSARLVAEHAPLPAINGGEVSCDDGTASGYDCDRVDLLSFLPREEMGAGRGARLNDVWGWTDALTGREFALVGRMDGTSFVDVSDPYNPRYLGNLSRTEGSPPSTWRDIKVFKDYAFIVADGAGEHGMQVFDLAQLRDVTEPREFEPTVLYTEVASSHNVAINEETGFAYLVGSSDGGVTCGGGSHMVDINDPLSPVFAGCFAHPNTGRRNTGNSHDTQCVIYHGPDEDYAGREICVNSNETALSVADVTDKDNPIAVAAADYPGVQYAHQGWLTEDHRYFFSNDELDEVNGTVDATRTLIWDLADLDDPFLLTEYMNPTRATDHNLYVRGDRLYMSNNRAGLRVLDISDPEKPFELGYFDTTPWSADEAGFDGTWSVYPYFGSGSVLVSSRREGLFIVRPRARRLIP